MIGILRAVVGIVNGYQTGKAFAHVSDILSKDGGEFCCAVYNCVTSCSHAELNNVESMLLNAAQNGANQAVRNHAAEAYNMLREIRG